MSEDLHNIDDLFKKGLEDHTEVPPSSVWESIDKNLDKKKVLSISKKYYKLKWAAAILLLFSIGMAMYTLHVSKRNKELVKQNNEKNLLRRAGSHVDRALNDSQYTVVENKKSSENRPKISSPENRQRNYAPANNGNKIKSPVNKDEANTIDYERRLNQHQSKNSNTKIALRPAASDTKTGADTIDQSRASSVRRLTNSPEIARLDKNKNRKQVSMKPQQSVTTKISTPVIETDVDEVKIASNPAQDNSENKPPIENRKVPVNTNVLITKERNIESRQPLPSLADATQITYVKPNLKFVKFFNDKLLSIKGGNPAKPGKLNLKNKNSPDLSATLFFSPNVVSTNIKNEEIHYREEDRREISKDEKSNFSSTVGALLDYNISHKLQLESGITFSSWTTNIEPKKIYARPDDRGNINYRFNCSAGYSYLDVASTPAPASGDSLYALRSNNKLQYLSVPVVLKYNMGKNRLHLVPGFGLAINFLTRGQIKTTIATNTGNIKASSSSIEGLRPAYLSGIADIAFQYNLSSAFSLAFIPSVRFSLSSINKNVPVKTNLYYFGFGGGIVIKL